LVYLSTIGHNHPGVAASRFYFRRTGTGAAKAGPPATRAPATNGLPSTSADLCGARRGISASNARIASGSGASESRLHEADFIAALAS